MSSHEVIDAIKERLAYVMSTKEAAVQQTLMLTEESLATLDGLKVVLQMQTHLLPTNQATDDLMAQITDGMEQVQQRLTEILMTQSYQDLTGQVLKRVMEDLDRFDGGTLVPPADEATSSSAGFGPAALHSEKADRAANQDDVDDLLAKMGL